VCSTSGAISRPELGRHQGLVPLIVLIVLIAEGAIGLGPPVMLFIHSFIR